VSGVITSSSLAPQVIIPTGNNPNDIAISDLDADGKIDLTVACWSDSSISVYRNIITGGTITTASFESKVNFNGGTYGALDIAVSDLNGDGKPDLIAANNSSNGTISVFENKATGPGITTSSFAPKINFATGGKPIAIAISDLDGDNKPDVVTVNDDNSISILRNTSGASSVIGGREINKSPKTFVLQQNYPNPFNPSTNISFSLASKAFVSLKVFDVLGREVSSLLFEELSAGSYSKKWNAEDLISGVYFYRLQVGIYTETKKLVLLR